MVWCRTVGSFFVGFAGVNEVSKLSMGPQKKLVLDVDLGFRLNTNSHEYLHLILVSASQPETIDSLFFNACRVLCRRCLR